MVQMYSHVNSFKTYWILNTDHISKIKKCQAVYGGLLTKSFRNKTRSGHTRLFVLYFGSLCNTLW